MLLALACAGVEPPTEDASAEAMLESHLRAEFAAWDSQDADSIALSPPGNGFGFRQQELRVSTDDPSVGRELLTGFFDGMEYYNVELGELHTAVDGDIGLAWGFFTEDFKEKGRDAERVRVRFTSTLKYEGGEWRPLLYHRDIQEFDEDGRYIRNQP